jgi:hypothetical protein
MQAQGNIVNDFSLSEAIPMKRIPDANTSYVMEDPAPEQTGNKRNNWFRETLPSIQE